MQVGSFSSCIFHTLCLAPDGRSRRSCGRRRRRQTRRARGLPRLRKRTGTRRRGCGPRPRPRREPTVTSPRRPPTPRLGPTSCGTHKNTAIFVQSPRTPILPFSSLQHVCLPATHLPSYLLSAKRQSDFCARLPVRLFARSQSLFPGRGGGRAARARQAHRRDSAHVVRR